MLRRRTAIDLLNFCRVHVLTYRLHQKASELSIDLRGAVDEHAAKVLSELLARLNAVQVLLNMEAVEYFNSLGIRAWANFVKALVVKRQVSYEKCPPDFMNHINMMPLLADSIAILSFTSEFVCPDCNHSQRELFDARKSKQELLSDFERASCRQCGAGLLPDEDPETILYFKNQRS